MIAPYYDQEGITIYHGDCLEIMPTLEANLIDSIVTDPPYGLSFMGKDWDHGVPGVPFWVEALRVAKPGAFMLAFGGTRTFHRLVVAIEDAGWEIRDCVMWIYGSGFPKSLDIGKAIDKTGGAQVAWFGPWFRKWREKKGVTQKQVASLFPSKTGGLTGCVANWELGFNMPTPEQFNLIRDTFGFPFDSIEETEREIIGKGISGKTAIWQQEGGMGDFNITTSATEQAKQWEGWGTALKPAWEPIIVARKPIEGTVANNVLKWNCGGINIDGSRIPTDEDQRRPSAGGDNGLIGTSTFKIHERKTKDQVKHAGRFPANICHDGSDEVMGLFPNTTTGNLNRVNISIWGNAGGRDGIGHMGDSGSAARFFYCAKSSKSDRTENGTVDNRHCTVKPTLLMRYLCRLVTPPNGLILDPFTGSGSTGKAAILEGFRFIGIELEMESVEIAVKRLPKKGLPL